jgi:two-component system cell cycle sensor histidine kinase/response regulator CckA
VTDTGAGIPADQISRIFDAGISSRLATGGSGLGLASVREIVRQAKGFLSVTSVEGRGSRFEIHLPLVERVTPPVISEGAADRSVLLVDDDPLVRRVAERALARAGWTVRCAGTGEDALEILLRTPCDLMISDIAMPGMDGVALARLALARQPGLPIILTSGYERTAEQDGGEITSVAFLAKPYDQHELLATVEQITR